MATTKVSDCDSYKWTCNSYNEGELYDYKTI